MAIDSISSIINNKTLSVSELTSILKDILEGAFPHLSLEGEISNYRPSSSGHVYFTLKDEQAAISAVMFKGKSMHLSFTPTDGMKVRVTGAISVYAQRGNYQIIIDTMEESGTGNILKLLEQRKQQFAKEGLFDSEKKQKLPFFPQTIGVVTSPTGAALRDILQILTRRNKAVSVVVLPCTVQGNDAGIQIAQQIDRANQYKMCDVLIIGRGGGSLEDLLPFSDECVVRSIYASKIPTISAVGHEIDWALSDFVADVRAPTPSAAAELAVPVLQDLLDSLESTKKDIVTAIKNKVVQMRLLAQSFSSESLELRFRSIEQPILQSFDDAKEDLLNSMKQKLTETKQRLALLKLELESVNPLAILQRGYSIVRDENGKLIQNANDITKDALITIQPGKGRITAKVQDTFMEE